MMSMLSILILLAAVLTSHAFRVTSHAQSGIVAFQSKLDVHVPRSIHAIQSIRGGDSDYDSESEYDDESEVEEDTKLSASAVKALKKAQAKKKAQTKKTVSASLKTKTSSTKTKPKSSGGLVQKIPYIVRAVMNPFTLFAMTRAYIASLVNIDYLKEDVSQDLRSALQEKAKAMPTGGKKRARKMRPGQAKTLSDLPQLSA